MSTFRELIDQHAEAVAKVYQAWGRAETVEREARRDALCAEIDRRLALVGEELDSLAVGTDLVVARAVRAALNGEKS